MCEVRCVADWRHAPTPIVSEGVCVRVRVWPPVVCVCVCVLLLTD